jgi:capsular exopolysaccharide synthesis family protein
MNEIQDSAALHVFDPFALINVLFERIKLIIGVTLLALLAGYTYITFQEPEYRGTALLQLNSRSAPMFDSKSFIIGRVDDQAAIQSELDILGSAELAQRVIDKLSLHKNGEFNPDYKFAIKDDTNMDERKIVEVLQAVQAKLTLNKDPLSYTVYLSFDSVDPNRARNIANAFVQEYLNYQIEMVESANREAHSWLSRRVDELRENVRISERAVQTFSRAHNLIELGGMTLDNRQMSELNSRLVEARSELAQSAARLTQAKKLLQSKNGIESVPEVLDSYLIGRLREQEADLVREKSELSGHFGENHPTMQRISGELRDLQAKIDSEVRKIVKGLENELEIATARVDSLEQDIAAMHQNLGESTRQEIELAELKREAQANREIYESFLGSLKESNEALNLEQTNAKIIAKAQLPLDPFKPNKPLIMVLFFLCGGFIGTSIALMLEYFSRGFTSPQGLEESLGIDNIGMAPELPEKYKKKIGGLSELDENSPYAEAVRRILANLQFSSNPDKPRCLLVLSSLPHEGKGWLSASLAVRLAQSGKKVLLLDCDLHKKSVGDVLGCYTPVTLNDYLSGDAALKDTILVDDATGVHFVGSRPTRKNVQPLMESEEMHDLVAYARQNYDLVLVDAPPVIGLSDVYFLSQLVDQAIFLVQWAKTPKHIVQHALRILEKTTINVVGTVLTRIDMEHYRRHEFGGSNLYKKYGDYYHNLDEFNVSVSNKMRDKIIKFRARR